MASPRVSHGHWTAALGERGLSVAMGTCGPLAPWRWRLNHSLGSASKSTFLALPLGSVVRRPGVTHVEDRPSCVFSLSKPPVISLPYTGSRRPEPRPRGAQPGLQALCHAPHCSHCCFPYAVPCPHGLASLPGSTAIQRPWRKGEGLVWEGSLAPSTKRRGPWGQCGSPTFSSERDLLSAMTQSRLPPPIRP